MVIRHRAQGAEIDEDPSTVAARRPLVGGHEEVEHAAPDNATAQAEHAGQDALRNHGTAAGRPAQYALHQFLSQLAYWSGQHIDAVLSAGDQAVWVEVWCDALADVPERHLRLRFPDPDAG